LVKSLPFVLKNGRLSSPKLRISLLICSEIIRSSSRKHDGYRGVAQQFCVATQLATPLETEEEDTHHDH
jgi:hypothetical protein